ncbi:MAG: Gfo/Idh/MocA family oxidoreductase [Flavobacteriales bacterium]|nr:Gfo/Idh/MocA family oxidoreductase [Flavobacteriales bacterium]
MSKTKIAIIGCGSIGNRHVAVVDANVNTELVAICDIDKKAGRTLSAKYDNVPYFESLESMLNDIEADIIHVCTPHHLHCKMAILALEKKFNVLVEKPMALSVIDCRKMIDKATEVNRKLYVVMQNRYNVPVKLVDDALSENHLGKILMVKCDILWNRHDAYYSDSPWRGKIKTEGGALYTQASHFIDLLVFWFGNISGAQVITDTLTHTIEIEDCGIASLGFSSGIIGSINWTTSVYNKNYEGSVTIIGEKGTVKIGGKYLNKIDYWDVKDYPLEEGIDFDDKPNSYGKYQGTSSNHDKVVTQMIKHLKGENVDMVEGEEGLKSIAAIELIYDQAKTTKIQR